MKHVQGIYDGKLTYAANWEGPDSYSPFSITWWDVVDFIGVVRVRSVTNFLNNEN